jgi:maltose-binding protein MalE
MWLDWTQDELAVLIPHLTDFQEKFPEIQISISYFPSEELLERYQAAAASGEEPTILFGHSKWTRELSQEGYIRDVHGRITEEFLESIHPIAWEGVTRSPFVLGLPFSLEGIVLYRNQGLIAESPATLDDLIESARSLEGEGQSGILIDVGFQYTGSFFQACDGEFLDPSGNLLLTVEAGQCWLEILDQWPLAGYAVQNSELDFEEFKAGRAAWLVDGTWNAQELIAELGAEQLAIDPWPIYSPTEKALSGYAWTRNMYFGVSSSSEDFDAAWILSRYLLTPEVQKDFGESTYGLHVPVLLSVPTVQPWLQQMSAAIESNVPFPNFPELSLFSEQLEVAAYDVSRRGYDPYYSILWVHPKIEKALRFANLDE